MFSMLFILVSFSKFLARDKTKCLFFKDKTSMARPTLSEMNPNELKYFPFIIAYLGVISQTHFWVILDVKLIFGEHLKNLFNKINKTTLKDI